jgi:hypothetical protein
MGNLFCRNNIYLKTINSVKYYYRGNRIHNDNDLPAIIDKQGDLCKKWWYQNGLLHRENDKPAFECSNENKRWYINGSLHRENDEPALFIVETLIFQMDITNPNHMNCDNMECEYTSKSLFHSDPCYLHLYHSHCDGISQVSEYYQNGKCHRNGDFPAVLFIRNNIVHHCEWFKYGRKYTLMELHKYYRIIIKFARHALLKNRLHKLIKLRIFRQIGEELISLPPDSIFPGGNKYHELMQQYV